MNHSIQTNALYKEAQMREFKKKQKRREADDNPTGATFKPKLVAKKQNGNSFSGGGGANQKKGGVVSRLYNENAARQKRLEKKKDDMAWTPEDTFQPDISRSQSHCESSSLQGARHEALFMAVSHQVSHWSISQLLIY